MLKERWDNRNMFMWGVIVPKVTAVCFLSSLLFFVLGYSKTLIIEKALTVNTNDYTLATGYYCLVIFFAVVGFGYLFYYVNNRKQTLLKWKTISTQKNTSRRIGW